MENTPTYVQIGPYTYCIVRHSRKDIPQDAFPNHTNQTISLAANLPPQMEAAGLLRVVCQIIFEMMGHKPEDAHGLSREFGATLAATMGASPEPFAWMMAGLLEDREDRKPKEVKVMAFPEGDDFFVPESVSAFLKARQLTPDEAIEQGVAHVINGKLFLYSKPGSTV